MFSVKLNVGYQKASWWLNGVLRWCSMQRLCRKTFPHCLSRCSHSSPLVRCECAIWLERNPWILSPVICAMKSSLLVHVSCWADYWIWFGASCSAWIRLRHPFRDISRIHTLPSIRFHIFPWPRPLPRQNRFRVARQFSGVRDETSLADLWGIERNDIVIRKRRLISWVIWSYIKFNSKRVLAQVRSSVNKQIQESQMH